MAEECFIFCFVFFCDGQLVGPIPTVGAWSSGIICPKTLYYSGHLLIVRRGTSEKKIKGVRYITKSNPFISINDT